MSIDFSARPQLINDLGNPRLGIFKYYGQPGTGDAENNPKVPFVDKDFVTSASATQVLNEFGETSVQLFLNGLYSISWFTGDATLQTSVLIGRADFVGIDASGGGGSDRVIDNVGDTSVQDEAGSLGAVFSATADSSLQYINSLAFVWNATTRDVYRPNGTDKAIEISATDVNIKHVGGTINAFNANSTSTIIKNALNRTVFSATDGTGTTLVDSLSVTDIKSDAVVNVVGGTTLNLNSSTLATLTGGTGVNIDATSGSVSITNSSASGAISLTSGSTGNITINSGNSAFVSISGGTSASLSATGNAVVSSLVGDVNLTSTASDINLLCNGASGEIAFTAGVTGQINITSGAVLNATGTSITFTGSTSADFLCSSGPVLIRGNTTLINSLSSISMTAASTSDINITSGNDIIVDTTAALGVHEFKINGTNRLVIDDAAPFFNYTNNILFNSSTSASAVNPIQVNKETNSGDANDQFMLFIRNGGSATIRMDAADALFFSPAASDIRLKSEYTELTSTLDKIAKVPVYNGKMRMPNDPSTKIQRTYFIADELKEQFPELVDNEGVEGIDDDGNKTTFLAVKRDMNEILWAAVRDAKIQIDQLRSELELLKNA